MELTIVDVDYAPAELYDQCPIIVKLIREIPGPDRPDYWLGEPKVPIKWIKDNFERRVNYIVLASRWENTRIEPNAKNLPVGIAYVTDETLLDDSRLIFDKCTYVAIGFSHVGDVVESMTNTNKILSGRIGKFFGTGNQG